MEIHEMSTEMLTKMIGTAAVPVPADINIKDYILKTYNSMEDLKQKATQTGNWRAKSDLSNAYRDGIPELDVEKDLDSAIGLLESIQSGNLVAVDILELGTLYNRKETPSYQRKAYEMYLKASRLGIVQAELNLAEMYRCGVEGVVTADLEEAFKWYRRAADEEKEDPLADDDISLKAHLTKGTMKRYSIDTKVKALTLLHKFYMSGECPEGKPQPQKGLYYLRKAATLGDIGSQKELGLTYLTGVSEVPKDLDQAKRWLEKAANHGNIEAKEILEKHLFDQQSVVEAAEPDLEANQQKVESSAKQYFDIITRKIAEKNERHPYTIENPLIHQESMFTQFPNSPTAQNYLKAFRLAKQGLDKLQKGSFNEAIKLMALSYLYENTILNSIPEVRTQIFRTTLISQIFEELNVNASFFEGLLVLVALYTPKICSTKSFGSFKIDLKKTMFLKNLIFLIEKYESPDKLPKQNPHNFEEDYSSWLHVIYYYLGSHYTIAEHYDDGAQAFEKALKCCPTYYEAKVALAYCLMNIFMDKEDENQRELKKVSNPEEQQDEDSSSKYMYKRVPKCSYLRWTQDDLKQKAEQLNLEYLKEAPVCDNKYPDCCYHLAYLYVLDHNIQKAREWKEKGEDAEEKRLPFMEPVSAGCKVELIALDMLPFPKKGIRRCSNKGCSSKPTDQLKPCPCKEAFYCGRDCQKKDWNKLHKKTCSERGKKK